MYGNTVSLNGLRGKPVIINFWSTWCIPCRDEMPYIQQIYEEWKDNGLVILAINQRDSISEVEQFVRDNDLSLSVLFDPQANISILFDVAVLPVTFFIDGEGIIQGKRIGAFSNKSEIENYLNNIM
jgi:thiol-disulfide isomerase/thioredoxin